MMSVWLRSQNHRHLPWAGRQNHHLLLELVWTLFIFLYFFFRRAASVKILKLHLTLFCAGVPPFAKPGSGVPGGGHHGMRHMAHGRKGGLARPRVHSEDSDVSDFKRDYL